MSREQLLYRVADFLESEARGLKESHSLSNGEWYLVEKADHGAKRSHDEMLEMARGLRELADLSPARGDGTTKLTDPAALYGLNTDGTPKTRKDGFVYVPMEHSKELQDAVKVMLAASYGGKAVPIEKFTRLRAALDAYKKAATPTPPSAEGEHKRPQTLMDEPLDAYAKRMLHKACGAWSDVRGLDGNIDQAKCEYASAIEGYARGAIDELWKARTAAPVSTERMVGALHQSKRALVDAKKVCEGFDHYLNDIPVAIRAIDEALSQAPQEDSNG